MMFAERLSPTQIFVYTRETRNKKPEKPFQPLILNSTIPFKAQFKAHTHTNSSNQDQKTYFGFCLCPSLANMLFIQMSIFWIFLFFLVWISLDECGWAKLSFNPFPHSTHPTISLI